MNWIEKWDFQNSIVLDLSKWPETRLVGFLAVLREELIEL